MKKVVIAYSGGLDTSYCAKSLSNEGFEVHAVSVNTGGFSKEEVEHLHHNEVEVKVKDFYSLNLAELNQELFDKVYGEGNIKSEEELKEKVKSELDEYFQQNADVHFVNKVLEQVSEKEEVKLPETFLVKWLLFSNQNIQSEEQAKEILESEKNQKT